MKIKIWCFSLLAILLVSCNMTPVDIKLKLRKTGKNKIEFEKVIDHYKAQKEKQKLDALYYLIRNMDYKYSLKGDKYDQYRKVYSKLINTVSSYRVDSVKNFVKQIVRTSEFENELDKDIIKADFLIKHIDIAFKTWQNAMWKNDVDFQTFCEYILPYRIENEGLSDWFEKYNQAYSDIFNYIYFKGGNTYKAINKNYKKLSTFNIPDLGKPMVRLLPHSKPLVFDSLYSYENGLKLVYIYFTNGNNHGQVKICVNNADTFLFNFRPVRDWYSEPKMPFIIKAKFREGNNNIQIIPGKDSIAIDYMDITNHEKFYRTDKNFKLIDGANYKIQNIGTSQCLEIEKGSPENNSQLTCGTYKGANSQQFNILNVNYGFFKLSPLNGLKFKRTLDVVAESRDNNGKIVIWDYQRKDNQQWAIIPVEKDVYKIVNRNSSKCLEILPYNKTVVQMEYRHAKNQLWHFERIDNKINIDSLFHLTQNTCLEAAYRVNDVVDFVWVGIDGLPAMPGTDILDGKTGNCHEEALHLLYKFRSLGIPGAIETVTNHPNIWKGHEWNSVIEKGNKAYYFQTGQKPGEGKATLPIAKVFRYKFTNNKKDLIFKKNDDEVIPPLFEKRNMWDVTASYSPVIDAKIKLFEEDNNINKHVYVCVFDCRNWVPIYWTEKHSNSAEFKDLGVDALYLPVYYDKDGITPASNAFIIRKDSTIQTLVPNRVKTQTLILKRKYPRTEPYWTDQIFDNGHFQGANKADFSDAVDLYVYHGNVDPNYYTVTSHSNKTFKYARYIGAKGQYSTIAELMFLDNNGNEITGKIIGTPGSRWNGGNTIEKAFDKNILTFYEGIRPDDTWLGIKFDKPTEVAKIRFIGRTEGNSVEKGDNYELKFWNNQEWEVINTQIAPADSLIFTNCPVNALFLLHDKNKGVQERLFVIDKKGKIEWR